jgi:hypothetical protein
MHQLYSLTKTIPKTEFEKLIILGYALIILRPLFFPVIFRIFSVLLVLYFCISPLLTTSFPWVKIVRFWSTHNARLAEVDELLLVHLINLRDGILAEEAKDGTLAVESKPKGAKKRMGRPRSAFGEGLRLTVADRGPEYALHGRAKALARLEKAIVTIQRRLVNRHYNMRY